MIESALADAFAHIGERQQELLGAFRAGFEPQNADVTARSPQRIPNLDGLSVAAPEGSYFVTTGPEGGLRLSRDGSFRFCDGTLCSSDGSPLLGFPTAVRGRPAPLRVDPVESALGRLGNRQIGEDGSVSYVRTVVDPRGGERRSERVSVGRLALAKLPAGTQPVRLDATHVAAPEGVDLLLGVPTEGAFGALWTHARDLGRLDPASGLQRLQEAYLALEALQAAQRSGHIAEQTVLDLVK